MLLSTVFQVLLLAPFLSAVSLPTHTSLRQGRTYYPCTDSSQCVPPLLCTDGRSQTCQTPPCYCLPASNRVRLCLSLTECPPGESCTSSPNFDNPFCIDTLHAQSDPSLQPLDSPNTSSTPFGLSYDPCADDAACAPGYVCVNDEGLRCASGSQCRCLPPEGPKGCGTGCRAGEMCAQGSFIGQPVCVSETMIRAEPDIMAIQDEPVPTRPPRPPRPDGTGVAFDGCQADVECRSPRRCYQDLETFCSSEMSGSCTCQYSQGLRECNGRGDCGEGEGCFRAPNGPGRYLCVSRDVARSLENLTELVEESAEATMEASMEAGLESGGRCIDAEMLEGWDRGELVFERDVEAVVLCDGGRSCATSGHMVVWNGRAMRMGRYCEEVGCERRVVRVNSPRWRRGLRVKSRTGGLEFTTFAARMDTMAEEVLLALMVRAGL